LILKLLVEMLPNPQFTAQQAQGLLDLEDPTVIYKQIEFIRNRILPRRV